MTVLEQPARARLDADGHQTVEVTVARGYHPDAIIARAGLPLRVVFHRNDGDACTERVVFSSPHIERRLSPIGATTVELPAQPPGEVRFTCGFGRYRGRIELSAERPRSLILRLRSGAARMETLAGLVLAHASGQGYRRHRGGGHQAHDNPTASRDESLTDRAGG